MNLKEYIEESLLDINELESNSDIEVKRDEIWYDLMEKYGSMLFRKLFSKYSGVEFTKDIIQFDKKGRIIFNDPSFELNLTIVPESLEKYGIGDHDNLCITHYEGKVSKLPLMGTIKTLELDSCKLDFDKKLKCETLKMTNCSPQNLKISHKQDCYYTVDAPTKMYIADKYLQNLFKKDEIF